MSKFRMFSAMAGVAVVLTMGVITLAVGANEAGAHGNTGGAGETVTSPLPPTSYVISAQPAVKAKPYHG